MLPKWVIFMLQTLGVFLKWICLFGFLYLFYIFVFVERELVREK
jgi:hypothetical protein